LIVNSLNFCLQTIPVEAIAKNRVVVTSRGSRGETRIQGESAASLYFWQCRVGEIFRNKRSHELHISTFLHRMIQHQGARARDCKARGLGGVRHRCHDTCNRCNATGEHTHDSRRRLGRARVVALPPVASRSRMRFHLNSPVGFRACSVAPTPRRGLRAAWCFPASMWRYRCRWSDPAPQALALRQRW
jgi:hypothetical protein